MGEKKSERRTYRRILKELQTAQVSPYGVTGPIERKFLTLMCLRYGILPKPEIMERLEPEEEVQTLVRFGMSWKDARREVDHRCAVKGGES